MAIHSVVVQNVTLEDRFPGGGDAFKRKCPNGTLCTDGVLTKVSFMAYDDAEFYRQRLVAEGLATSSDDATANIALMSQSKGVQPPSDWLEVGHVDGRTVAWLAGTDCGQSALPWPEAEDLIFVDAPLSYSRVEAVSSLEARTKPNQRASADKTVYIGRPFVSILATKWWQFWTRPIRVLDEKSCDRAIGTARDIVMAMPWPAARPPGSAARRRLERARSLLEQVSAFRSQDSAEQFLLGRANDLLIACVVAYARYQRAHTINPDNDAIGRSLVLVCLRLGRGVETVRLSQHLLACFPEDAGLMANHALVLLIAGDVADVTAMVERALSAGPDDKDTQAFVEFITSVRAGRRPRPDHWPL